MMRAFHALWSVYRRETRNRLGEDLRGRPLRGDCSGVLKPVMRLTGRHVV